MRLLEPLSLGARAAANRVMFGPIVTNLGDDDRRFTHRHTAFYERRAAGGCGIIVTEGASVHPSDWPYERAPLAERCAEGWAQIATACHAHGSLVIASLDHAGGQGSSAYSQAPLWAPSRVPEVNTREVPKWMEDEDIAAVIDGFAAAARTAGDAGCDGAEINAGQHSLVRQFLSGLTNQRTDRWGADRLAMARAVIDAVRAHVGIVGLRLSCDELAPWAGITPQAAPALAAQLALAGLDYVVVVRGSIFSADKTRADYHEPTAYNVDVARAVRAAVRQETAVVVQGAIVHADQAEAALAGDPAPDAVEMTRAQLADPDLVSKLAGGRAADIRPCTRCNQTCQVRDARNPIITCVGEPSTGHETDDPDWTASDDEPRDVLIIGGGPAGLEAGRVAARRGHRVTIAERAGRVGGMAAVAGPHAELVRWLERAAVAAGATITVAATTGHNPPDGAVVVQCTGSRQGRPDYGVAPGALFIDVAEVRAGTAELPEGTIALVDPIGGPIAVELAAELGRRAVLITPDQIAGNELSRTGDLAPANVRLAQAGVRIERRSIVRSVGNGSVTVEDRFSGQRRVIEVAATVDCGFRLPSEPLPGVHLSAGDCVAPRTVHEAILEGRRAAASVSGANR